jgi:hypothetical protein
MSPEPDNDDEQSALVRRIRGQERERARREALESGLKDVLTRLDRFTTSVQDHEGRLRRLEDRAVTGDKLVARMKADDWGGDDWDAMLPMVREWKESRHGRGRWRERVAIGVSVAAILGVAFQVYLTLRGQG